MQPRSNRRTCQCTCGWGGKIYTLADKKVFRVKKKADDKVDRKFSFNHVPFAAAWKKRIDFIAS